MTFNPDIQLKNVTRLELTFPMCVTYKFKSTVVRKKILHPNTPVWPGLEVSFTLWWPAHEAAPRINLFEFVKGSRSNQDLQAVFTKTSRRAAYVYIWYKYPIEIQLILYKMALNFNDFTITCSSLDSHRGWLLGLHNTQCNMTGSHPHHNERVSQWSFPT